MKPMIVTSLFFQSCACRFRSNLYFILPFSLLYYFFLYTCEDKRNVLKSQQHVRSIINLFFIPTAVVVAVAAVALNNTTTTTSARYLYIKNGNNLPCRVCCVFFFFFFKYLRHIFMYATQFEFRININKKNNAISPGLLTSCV